MSLTFGFYNSINGDRVYDAIQMGQIFDGIIKDGIYATYEKAMVVKASSNPSEVIVQPGRAWFNHTWTYVDADLPITTPDPEVILDRVDTLVLDINAEYAARENQILWVQGTPSSLNPESPELTNTVTHHQYPLCNVYRKAGTTMIYAADITNRVGTSDTPFVTGIIDTINIDSLLAQWDDEFHTWEDTTKTQFEGWMVNQQAVYTTWFNSIKDQMEGDLDEFEDWFETIQGIIDSEAATHLQDEIDDLREMLPAGSHIDINTSESTLLNRNVTVEDTASHSKTVQFDAYGNATVESFPYIGQLTVTSTDGERIATEVINTPYFGRYNVTLAFWSATVELVGDSASLAGLVVSVKDSTSPIPITSIALDSTGHGVFTATYPDNYTFTYTYGGQTMEVSLAVTEETTYTVNIHAGFNYAAWLEAGRVSGTYSSLDDVLADEEALRQLFLVHDSVDYFAQGNPESEDVIKIFNTDLAAKWINLSDYALDTFYAVAGLKSIMDTADKYGYGEWCLMPQVPTMTSNTAPYGEAIGSNPSESSYPAWKAFNGSTSDGFVTNVNTDRYLGYHFTDSQEIKSVRIYYQSGTYQTQNIQTFKVQSSDDGTTYADETDVIVNTTAVYGTWQSYDITPSGAHTYWRVLMLSNFGDASVTSVVELQFYAYAPKGNVPVMTSNTAPYGTASANSSLNDRPAYKAFDGDESSSWAATGGGGVTTYLTYKFANPVNVRRVKYRGGHSFTKTIQYSDDNSTWYDAKEIAAGAVSDEKINDFGYHLYWRTKNLTSASDFHVINTLQFYGRELKVSVPAMTSNTAPYGIANANSEYSSSYPAWKAFDDTGLTTGSTTAKPGWSPLDGTVTNRIYYVFSSKVMPKKARIGGSGNATGASKTFTGKVVASNNLTSWTPISEDVTCYFNAVWTDVALSASEDYLYVGFETSSVDTSSGTFGMKCQFFGENYSEKEFEAGATKKWLYDHGVELETLDKYKGSNTTSALPSTQKSEMYLETVGTAGTSNFSVVGKTIDLTLYSLFRAKIGSIVVETYTSENTPIALSVRAVNAIPSGGTYSDGQANYAGTLPYNNPYSQFVLDVSSFNESKWISAGVYYRAGRKGTITELWLE